MTDGDWIALQKQVFNIAKNLAFAYVAINTSYELGYAIYRRGAVNAFNDAYRWIKLRGFLLIRKVPAVNSIIQKELTKVVSDMETKLIAKDERLPTFTSLPTNGKSLSELDDLLAKYSELDNVNIAHGKISGTVYGMDGELRDIMLNAFTKYFYSNPLHPDVFKSLRKMEAEVVAMTLSLFKGDVNCVGTVTSGGTESILLACKAYRDHAKSKYGITFPEIIAPITVHAAFEKAAQYFDIKLVHVDIDNETGRVNMDMMRKAINANTIALVGSAPNFSLGIIDDIASIAELAKVHGIGCHIDACLGSFLLPHLVELLGLPPVDFTIPGVTSISCDLHKYGFGPKGASVIMYRTAELLRAQYFVSTEWTGGIYATPTLLGSRSGAIVAATWAAMLATGTDGYKKAAMKIRKAVEIIAEGIRTKVPELYVVGGEPNVSIVALASKKLNIYAVNDEMSKLGWHLNALQNPPAVHIACTLLTTQDIAKQFIADIMTSVQHVKEHPLLNLKSGTASIYGTSTAIPDKSIIEDVAKGYIDILYKL